MKSKSRAKNKSAGGGITGYIKAQKPEYAKICRQLRKEIAECLPKASSKLYHSQPVWFVGENAVVGFSVTSKNGVNLLFWNGKNFGEADLKPVGKFEAAQIQLQDESEINSKKLRRWLKKAGRDIWDFAALRKNF